MTRPLKHTWWGGHRWGTWALREAEVHKGARKIDATIDMRKCQVSTCQKTEVRYL